MKNKGGRPPLEIDEEMVEKLASICCTMNEMASILECSVDTLERRFADIIEKGRSKGKSSLRRKQYEVAMGGNPTMLIWLGKQQLGQTDKRSVEVNQNLDIVNSTPKESGEEILKRVKKMLLDE